MNKSGMSASKCVAYARVSTENEGQAESCANQIALCQEYAERHPEYILDGKYVDDGISGATNKRPQFTAMIERIKQGDIRYIIAKNEDRLCRSTEIDGYLMKVCREYDVKIIFLESNKIFNPNDGQDLTVHGIMAVMGQQYVFHQSQVGKIAHEQKCKAKRLNATDVRYGYYWDKERKCMAVNEHEAEMVRKMFEWYVYNGLGVSEIAKKLAEHGVFGARSGKMLTANTVSARLEDEAYKGTFYINKKGSILNVGMDAKKKRFDRPKEEWVAVEGPAIVSEELFELAQRLREERRHVYDKTGKADTQARFRGTHLFLGKVFCGDCKTQFHFRYADRAKTIGEYKDYFSKSRKTLDAVCHNKKYNRIYEQTLITLCRYAINIFLKEHEACINNLKAVIRDSGLSLFADDKLLKDCQMHLEKVERERQKNLVAWRDAPDESMKQAYLEMYKSNDEEKKELEKKISGLIERRKDAGNVERKIDEIHRHIEDMKQINEIDRSVVQKFIEKIIIEKNGIITIILKFGAAYSAILPDNRKEEIEDVLCLDKVFILIFDADTIASKLQKYWWWRRCSDRARWKHQYRTCKFQSGYVKASGDNGTDGHGPSCFRYPQSDCFGHRYSDSSWKTQGRFQKGAQY